MIHLFRLLVLFLAANAALVGFTFLLLYYERTAAEGARGARRPFRFESLARGLGAWARETGALVIALSLWPRGILPRPRIRPGAWLPVRTEARPGAPVLLVPGYALNRGTLELLRRRLEATGRPTLAIDLPVRRSVPQLAELLETAVLELKDATGAPKVDLVCHSRGGIVARWWIQKKGGAAHVDRCVTMGSAFSGTRIASFAFGPSANDMLPGSGICADLAAEPLHPDVSYFAINGEADSFVLPPGGDELPAPGTNVRIPDVGHNGMLLNAGVWHAILAAVRRQNEAGADGEAAGFEDESADEAAARTLARFPR